METRLHLPDDVVNANDAVRLLLIVDKRRLRHYPGVTAGTGQEPVPACLALAFADDCGEKEAKHKDVIRIVFGQDQVGTLRAYSRC